MKSLILLICLMFYGTEEQEFQKVSLFNGKFIYLVPKGMRAFEPLMAYDEDYKYVKYYLNKDSSLRIEVNLRYSQLNELHKYQESEQNTLLSRIDGADKQIISNEVKIIQNRKVVLVSCQYALPGMKRDKGIAERVAFNTSAGLTSVTVLYSFKTLAEKKEGQLLFERIIEKLEMH